MASESKRKVWSEESMVAATSSIVDDNMSLREAFQLYNVPFETLRRCLNGSIRPWCKPGPHTVFTDEEEEWLVNYLIQMSDMGFGLSRDRMMHLAYNYIVWQRPTKASLQGWEGRMCVVWRIPLMSPKTYMYHLIPTVPVILQGTLC